MADTNNNSNSNDNNDSGNNTSGHSGNENDNSNGNSGNGNENDNVNSDNNNVNHDGDRGGNVNNNNNLSGGGQDSSNVDDDPKINSSICLKSDFFPEESFKSWSNYSKALMETKARLKERLLARSSDDFEINGMRARSQNQMKRSLNWFDLIWFGVGAVMGAGVFVLTGEAVSFMDIN